MHEHMHVRMLSCLYLHVYVQVCMYMYMYMHTYRYMCICMCMCSISSYIQIYTDRTAPVAGDVAWRFDFAADRKRPFQPKAEQEQAGRSLHQACQNLQWKPEKWNRNVLQPQIKERSTSVFQLLRVYCV